MNMGPAEGDTLLEETLSRLFAERCGPEVRQAAETEGWAPELWEAMAEAELAWVGVPEQAGGPGGDLVDAATLVRMAGRHGVPLPVAECSGLLGGWVVATAGLSLPEGPLTVALPHEGDRLVLEDGELSGCLTRVPWGGRAAAVVAVASSEEGEQVVLVDPAACRCTRGQNLAGEARDQLTLVRVPIPPEHIAPATNGLGYELTLRGALSRVLLMAGAMETVGELTVAYASQRRQFGRPIGAFQAVAQRLVHLVSEAEAGALAAEVAARRFAAAGVEAAFEISAAKATASRAASEVAAHAHQVHGAIGMTQEYPLHHFTRRLWAWRQEWGSEAVWAHRLGGQIMAAGAAALWPRVATGLVGV